MAVHARLVQQASIKMWLVKVLVKLVPVTLTVRRQAWPVQIASVILDTLELMALSVKRVKLVFTRQ